MQYDVIAPMMGALWSPIAAVTSRWRGQANAQICVSIGAASIVPEKPRVVVQVYKTNHSHDMVMGSGAFALNFPLPGQLHWIKDFGMASGRDRDKLAGVDHKPGPTGSPILTDCWGYLDCRVVNAMDGGDMTCFLAEVLEGATRAEGEPLWWRDARRQIPRGWMAEYERKQSGEVAHSRVHMGEVAASDQWPGPVTPESVSGTSLPEPI